MQDLRTGVSEAACATTAEARAPVFLSPEWIEAVFAALRQASRTDLYLKKTLSRFTLGVVYVVDNLPAAVKEYYAGDRAVIFARLEKGALTDMRLGAAIPGEHYNILVKSDYRIARQILAGDATPVGSFVKRRLLVEAVDFRHWPKYVPKATIAANLVLKLARRIPVTFPAH